MGKAHAPENEYDAEMKAIGAHVRALRQDRGWGAGRLAEQAGLHWTYVREIEQGKRRFSVVTLLKLAAGLEIDPCILLRRDRPLENETSARPRTSPARRRTETASGKGALRDE